MVPSTLEKTSYYLGLRPVSQLTPPDFLGIGFMKCGTTWLYENLRAHPEVYMSDAKELRYFHGSRFHASLRSYAQNFADGGGRVSGEFSPSYVWLPSHRVAFIRRVMPELKILVMLRDPVQREWSRVTHQFEGQGVPIAEAAEPDVLASIDSGHAMHQGGYSATLDRWRQHFPAERTFIGLYEDIQARPEQLLTRVFQHIGVGHEVDWSTFPVRKVIVPPAGDRYADRDQGRGVVAEDRVPSTAYFPDRYRARLTDIYAAEIHELHRRFGDDILAWASARQVLDRST